MMYRRMILKGCFVLLSLLLSSASLAETSSSSNLVSTETLARWGYRPLTTLTYLKSYCDKSTIVKRYVRYQAIKSVKPVPEHSHLYYRYTLIVESYRTESEVNSRLTALRNPANISSKHAKLCNLRKIFSDRNNIYMVHTDAGVFTDNEMSRVFLLFRQSQLN